MLCIFIVHQQGLLSDFEEDLCDKYNTRTDEQLTLLEFINKQCRSTLFTGRLSGTFWKPTNSFSDEPEKHFRYLLIEVFTYLKK